MSLSLTHKKGLYLVAKAKRDTKQRCFSLCVCVLGWAADKHLRALIILTKNLQIKLASLAKVPGLRFGSVCVVAFNRVLHGTLEGGLVLWVPVPEWF